jgi:phage-related protein
MKSFSAYVEEQSNQIANNGAWIILLELTLGTTTFRLANNNLAIIYNTYSYEPYPFKIDPIQESLKGDLPQMTLMVANVGRYLEPYLHQYAGGVGVAITLTVVFVQNNVTYTVGISETFNISSTKSDANWVYFTLSINDPLTKRFPRDRYIASMCRHRFKSVMCRYVGAATTCDKTLARCEELGNSTQYGGSPGVAEGVYV